MYYIYLTASMREQLDDTIRRKEETAGKVHRVGPRIRTLTQHFD
jgi:hypothetical protein